MKNQILKTKKLYQGLGWPTLFTQIRFFTAPYEKLTSLCPKTGLIIDLGCGYGTFSNLLGLVNPGAEILGIELDKNKIKYANHGIKNVKFLHADITKIKVKKAKAILLIHVLHHLNSYVQQEQLITACRKKLPQDGRIIIAEVIKKPWFKYFLGWLTDHLLYPGDKILYRTAKDFCRLFTKCGFRTKIIPAHQGKPFAHIIYVLEKS